MARHAARSPITPAMIYQKSRLSCMLPGWKAFIVMAPPPISIPISILAVVFLPFVLRVSADEPVATAESWSLEVPKCAIQQIAHAPLPLKTLGCTARQIPFVKAVASKISNGDQVR
jgi:hypothetical protein